MYVHGKRKLFYQHRRVYLAVVESFPALFPCFVSRRARASHLNSPRSNGTTKGKGRNVKRENKRAKGITTGEPLANHENDTEQRMVYDKGWKTHVQRNPLLKQTSIPYRKNEIRAKPPLAATTYAPRTRVHTFCTERGISNARFENTFPVIFGALQPARRIGTMLSLLRMHYSDIETRAGIARHKRRIFHQAGACTCTCAANTSIV